MTTKKYVLLSGDNIQQLDNLANCLNISRNQAANLIIANPQSKKLINELINISGGKHHEEI